jgi:O-antigen ligase
LYPLLFSFLVQLYFALTAKIHIALNPTNRGLERITGLSKNANDEGRLLVFGIVTLLLLINYIKNRTFKVAAIILIGCFYYAIFRTGSRSSLLAVTLMFLSYIFLLSKKKNYGLLIATIAGIFLIYHFSYDYILNNTSMGRRLELAAAHGEQNVRILLIKEGWQFFLSRPIIGLGLGSFTAYSTGNYYSHNDYIEILASLGLPAFLLYMSIFYDYWKKGIKIFQHVNVYYKSAIVVSLAFLFGYLALGIWDPSFYFPTTTLMLAFFYSLIIKMYQFLLKDKHRVKYLIKKPLEIVKTDV